jgi:peptide/nickel transport system permease protein
VHQGLFQATARLKIQQLFISPHMPAFILRRLAQALVVMGVVAFISFMLFQYVGDPVVFLLGQDARPDQIAQLRRDLGLDQPFVVQFGHFLVNAVQGEFGLSLRQGAKVSRLIAEVNR